MKRHFWKFLALSLGLLLAVWLICYLLAEVLWFREVNYLSVYWLRLVAQAAIWSIATSISTVFLLGNLGLAQRLKHTKGLEPEHQGSKSYRDFQPRIRNPLSRTQISKSRIRSLGTSSRSNLRSSSFVLSLPFGWLLVLALGISLLLTLLLFHHGHEVWRLWQHNIYQSGMPSLPNQFSLASVWAMAKGLLFPQGLPLFSYFGAGLLLLVAIALLIYPKPLLNLIAILMSVALGTVLAANWGIVLQFLHPTSFTEVDPLFSRDVSFYIFLLPFWELLEFWLVGVFLYGLAAVTLIYLLSGNSLNEGRFLGFSSMQRRHLSGLAAGLMLVIALSCWVSRYELLYSLRGVTYGASYTDVNVELPAYTALSLLAGAIALFLIWRAFLWKPKTYSSSKPAQVRKPQPYTLILLSGFLTLATISTIVLPTIVQPLVVQPNELLRERPFIQRSIASTREAFDLDSIDVQTFNPQDRLTYTDLQNNELTIRNIRLWDTRPLLQTNRQLQQIRPYYRFLDADIDRYGIRSQEPGVRSQESGVGSREENAETRRRGDTEKELTTKNQPLTTEPTQNLKLKTQNSKLSLEKQQVLISARELDYSAVPEAAKTWVNEHLVYTHGYGFTLSPVNKVATGGLPDYFVKDIGTGTGKTGAGELSTSSQLIRDSIPIEHPRIYYGELTNTYVMTGTRVKELDYPSGDDNVYNTYDGQGGIDIGALWRRWLFAIYLRDWQMVLTNNFNPQSKLLFRRNVNQRIQTIAPFLTYDRDPYLVVAKVNNPALSTGSSEAAIQNSKLKTQNSLYWIVDAYTTSDRYPYSDPAHVPGIAPINYIRNSVKVVIDAYSGSVTFYIANAKDPIIQTWAKIFPGMFKPLSEMPTALQGHIRYPNDLFAIQSERLMTYHMTDPQVFYNREDQWQIPKEIYGSEAQLVEPYYLIMKLPSAQAEEFILLLPFTPQQRTNLTAWFAARSDGENYGKSLLYVFPKELLVYGTEQIEACINQDPIISQQISLWNRQGSRVIQGNLLVIPIERSLLYVEPLYLEATQNSLPTLVRVIVSYENNIVMAETLDQALRAIFQPKESKAPAIVR